MNNKKTHIFFNPQFLILNLKKQTNKRTNDTQMISLTLNYLKIKHINKK